MEPGLGLLGANAPLGSRKVAPQHPQTLHRGNDERSLRLSEEVFNKRAIYLHQPAALYQEDDAQGWG